MAATATPTVDSTRYDTATTATTTPSRDQPWTSCANAIALATSNATPAASTAHATIVVTDPPFFAAYGNPIPPPMPVATNASSPAPIRPPVDGTNRNSAQPAATPSSATSRRAVVLKGSRGRDGVERVEPVGQVRPDDHVLVDALADLAGVELEAASVSFSPRHRARAEGLLTSNCRPSTLSGPW